MVRKKMTPDHPDANFAGYLVWRASIPRNELPLDAQPETTDGKVRMMNSSDGFLFGSVMEDIDGITRVGCTWYDNHQSELLYRLGAVKDNVVQYTIDEMI